MATSPRPRRSRQVSPRKAPRQARSKATVEAVLAAAARVFGVEGYARGTTNRIAQKAGISIGSLYEYFPSKDAILVALGRQHLREARVVVLASLDPTLPLPSLLRRVVRAMIALHEANPRLHRILFEETRLPELLRREVDAAETELIELAYALFVARPDFCRRDPLLAAYFVVHLVESMTHSFVLRPPAGIDVDRFVDEAVVILARYLDGVSERGDGGA